MKYSDTQPYDVYTGQLQSVTAKQQFVTASSVVPETMQDQVQSTLASLQTLRTHLYDIESRLFGPTVQNEKTPSPPFSSVGGNIYESRSIAQQCALAAQAILSRI